jgi:hypothetical protein
MTREQRATRYVVNTLPARCRHLAAGLVSESGLLPERTLTEFYRELANNVVKAIVRDDQRTGYRSCLAPMLLGH